MSDFSYFSLFTAGLACFAPLAAAWTQPTGNAPVGNPIYEPGLNSIVAAGQDFTITWKPTTPGTVTLLLLKGPSTNAVAQYAIVEKIPNDGSYVWHVSSDLAATPNAQGYGIQLIDDATGQYQYTTQFGVSNDHSQDDEDCSTTSSGWWTSSAVWAPTSTSTVWAPTSTSTVAPTWTSAVDTTCTEETSAAAPTSTWTSSTVVSPVNITSWAPTATSTWISSFTSKPLNVTIAPTGRTSVSPVWTSSVAYSSPTLSASAAATTTASPYRGSASTVQSSFAGLAAAGLVALFAF